MEAALFLLKWLEKAFHIYLGLVGLAAICWSVYQLFFRAFAAPGERIDGSHIVLMTVFGGIAIEMALQWGLKQKKRDEELESKLETIHALIGGHFSKMIDDPNNVWANFRDKALQAETSINIAISVKDFSSPIEWDKALVHYLHRKWFRHSKDIANKRIAYRVLVYRKDDDTTEVDKKNLSDIKELYLEKSVDWTIHEFLPCSQYFGLNVAIVDGKYAAILWDTDGKNRSNKGIFFEDAKIAMELDRWFRNNPLALYEKTHKGQ